MKKWLNAMAGLLLLAGLGACGGITPPDDNFDMSLLYGTWQEGTVYEHYYQTPFQSVLLTGDTVEVNGTTWDIADDVSEDEAQLFNWTLNGATLTQEHVGTFATVPKVYTVNKLTYSGLTYSDNYGKTHHFVKVN